MRTNPAHGNLLLLQIGVFSLVAAAISNIYVTQPVLPVLQNDFSADLVHVSLTVSAVILGMTLSTLPFGILADRLPIGPIIITGSMVLAIAGIIGFFVTDLNVLIGLRFLQGLFIPALTSSLAAYLAKNLPVERLSVVMGSYVSATVCGGLGGRLIGGWVHHPLHWRYALISLAAFTIFSMIIALIAIKRNNSIQRTAAKPSKTKTMDILRQWSLWRSFITAFSAFFIFSSIFNYLPFLLSGEPFHLNTNSVTAIYLVYIMGIFMGPISGRMAQSYGTGITLLFGNTLIGISMALTLLPYTTAIIIGLVVLCTGFFTTHAAAVGSLNKRLTGGQGRANALYVLFYYAGGTVGISISGFAYDLSGWLTMISVCFLVLTIPFFIGFAELRDKSDV